MKKIFLLAAVAIASLTINAAEWDFGEFANQPGLTSGSSEIDGLGFYACDPAGTPFDDKDNKRFGLIVEKAKTCAADGYRGTKICKSNGAGANADAPAMPKQRYLYFNVSGNSHIKVWFESGSGDKVVTVFISDGSKILGQREVAVAEKDDMVTVEGDYVGAAGTIYIFSSVASFEVYKIEASAAQGIDNVEAVKAEKFYRDGQLIIRKNGVEYNALGAKL
jgi:hypothetical protein